MNKSNRENYDTIFHESDIAKKIAQEMNEDVKVLVSEWTQVNDCPLHHSWYGERISGKPPQKGYLEVRN